MKVNDSAIVAEKKLSFRKTEALLKRRKAIVADAVGIFCPTTVMKANQDLITDADGNNLIDFGGGIGVLNAGHCPEPVVKAIQEQAEKLIHSCFHVSTYEVYIQLCEKLASLLPHGDATKVMLTNTGAEAVENAIKIARQATRRSAIICFTEAFHGRTMMAMSLTSKVNYKADCGPFAPEVYRIPFPDYYHLGMGLDEDEFINQQLDQLEKITHSMVAANQVAAVIIELVQGEGGFNIASKKYIQGLRKFCDRHGIVLIFDEVQSGFCRTGKWAAFHHYNVIPDLSTWAKSMGSGMPIGAVIGKKNIMDAALPGTIGGTYPGNPVCCAASLATIDFMEKEKLNDKAIAISRIVKERFLKMQKQFSCIGDVRGLGAMQAIELVKDNDPSKPDGELTSRLIHACLQRGLILLSAGTYKNVIRILSPLVISTERLNEGLNIIEQELQKINNKL
ncbi:MAG: 4-aminobutyrate--2-oxoglutarate transaminase [Chitinophagaceae bacterium]